MGTPWPTSADRSEKIHVWFTKITSDFGWPKSLTLGFPIIIHRMQ